MAVTLLGIHGRSASNELGIRTYTDVYKAKTSDRADDAYDVGSVAGLPVISDTHSSDSAAYCTSIQVENSDPWSGWDVTCTYSTAREINSDPTSDEILLEWTSEIYQEPIFTDVDGDAILNSAGDYFIDPAQMRDASHLIVKIMTNVGSVPTWVLSYQNAVNDGAITIGGLSIAQGLAKMQAVNISSVKRRGASEYYELSFDIHLHLDGWRSRPLDAGFRELLSGTPVQIKDANGDEVTTPVCLDGSGAALTSPTPSTAVFGNYTIYPELDFTALPGVT